MCAVAIRQAICAVAMFLVSAASGAAIAQPACSLDKDPDNPAVKILRCGHALTVRSAPGTRPELRAPEGESLPTSANLDSGALMIEGETPFQLLTPHAVAAVRGTKWAVEVKAKQTSVLTISGRVEVNRSDGKHRVALKAGEGVDVSRGGGPLEVKRWKKKRVRALLARFGQ
jgi:ferric-dicitrate binding protein FerR (iron transport regulator)